MSVLGRSIKTKLLALLMFLLIIFFLPSFVFADGNKTNTAKNLEEFLFKGNFSGKIRSYYMNRTFYSEDPQLSTAIGMWLNYKSALWNNVSFTLTGFTSQPFFNNNSSYGGASLLTPDQKGFSVLGRAFLEAPLGGKNTVRLYRQTMDTPFINTYDFRMVPVTVEAYTLTGNPSAKLNYMFSHITKIKGWTDTSFSPMSDYAGFPGTSKPVSFAGVNYSPNNIWKLQLWDYVCYDFMNIVYFQSDANWPMKNGTLWSLSTQILNQQSMGQAIDGQFQTGMWGVLGGYTWKGLNFTLAYNSTSNNHDIVNPWGAYQGYSSLMEEDCDLASERAWTTGIAYDFSNVGIKGLTAFANHSRSHLVNSGDVLHPRQHEFNLTFDYSLSDSLKLRLRESRVTSAFDMNDINYSDTRIILNYNF